MRGPKKNDQFRIRRIVTSDHGIRYQSFQVVGYLHGERIRKKFQSREDALGELNRLTVLAANSGGITIRPVNTRLTPDQVRGAELAIERLGSHALKDAIDWFLANYRPPLVSTTIENAAAEFMRDREGQVSTPVIRDYRKVLSVLLNAFPGRKVDAILTTDLETVMGTWGQSKKSWNNIRTYLHAFFAFCAHPSRRWVTVNPVKAIQIYEIARGIPDIVNAEIVAKLFAFLETYSGPPRSGHKAGYLVPYFALATFAGIRPSVRDGELLKIHQFTDKDRLVDLAVGVIRITPEIAKTNDLRQVTIQPNLAAWLKRYPISDFPLIVPNMMDHVGTVRKKFGLTADVLRHTFISMHVAKFKSLGSTALEAGNSESIIKKHYLSRVTDAVSDAFWGIVPRASVCPDCKVKPEQIPVDTTQAS